MNLGDEDKLECLSALLDLLTCCDENINIESVQNTAMLASCLVNDLKPTILSTCYVTE